MNKLKQRLIAIGLSGAIASGGVIVAKYEGKENKPYLDPVNILTVCYGATSNIIKDKTYTDDECLSKLADDLVKHNNYLMKYVKVPMNENQHAALLSFIYNVGPLNFKLSTLLRKLNSGDYTGACNELPRWNKAKGKVLAGLTNRREEEKKLCLGLVKY